MRNTKQKALIKEALDSGRHLSAEEIYIEINTKAKIDMSTIYRNLNRMSRNDEIERIMDSSGVARYHIKSIHHGHLICLKCSSITEVPCNICSELHDMSNDMSFDDVEHVINIYGYCKKCRGGK